MYILPPSHLPQATDSRYRKGMQESVWLASISNWQRLFSLVSQGHGTPRTVSIAVDPTGALRVQILCRSHHWSSRIRSELQCSRRLLCNSTVHVVVEDWAAAPIPKSVPTDYLYQSRSFQFLECCALRFVSTLPRCLTPNTVSAILVVCVRFSRVLAVVQPLCRRCSISRRRSVTALGSSTACSSSLPLFIDVLRGTWRSSGSENDHIQTCTGSVGLFRH